MSPADDLLTAIAAQLFHIAGQEALAVQPELGTRTALVTGAGSGIGAAIGTALAGEGCRCYLADLRIEAARTVAAEIACGGGQARALEMDVADPESVRTAVDAVLAESGRVDVLINSAGLLSTGSVLDTGIEAWRQVIDVNLSGVFYCTRAVLPAMIDHRSGRVVNIASVSAVKGGGAFGNVAYGTAKAGVVAMTKGVARESAGSGITVNAIAPGPIASPMTAGHLAADPELLDQVRSRIPAGRLGQPSEIACLAAFLASDAAGYVTGSIIVADGGFLTA